MTKNKGKPSQQKADERVERDGNRDPASPRTIHRLDRSQNDEQASKRATPKRALERAPGNVEPARRPLRAR